MKTTLPATFAATLLLAACAGTPTGDYGKPYGLLQTESKMPTDYVRPAWVAKIDGKDIVFGKNDPVEPGLHKVTVSLSGPPGSNNLATDTIDVDVKPCTRYFMSSKRSTLQSNDWKAFVSGSETIGECASRHGLK
jgi:hypothetical protein